MAEPSLPMLLNMCCSQVPSHVACLLHEIYSKRIVYVGKDTWYEFTNHRWHRSTGPYVLRKELTGYVLNMFRHTANNAMLRAAVAKDAQETELWANKAIDFSRLCYKIKHDVSFITNVLKASTPIFKQSDFETNLDSNKHLIGFDNGVYDLDQKIFRHGLPTDYITYSTGYPYTPEEDPDVKTKIAQLLHSITNDPQSASTIMTICANMLHGHKSRSARGPWLVSGRNGRSTLSRLLSLALGDYYHDITEAAATMPSKVSVAVTNE